MEITQQMPYSPMPENLTMQGNKQPWVYSKWLDGIFILLPPFIALLLVSVFKLETKEESLAWWVILVLFIDVSHVYSTIYRTYFDKVTLKQHPRVFISVPFIAWGAGVAVYMFSGLLFWRLLAYMAVYHFVRQQYGFLRIYSRREQQAVWEKRIDNITIYTATIYPLCYWHLKGPLRFNWFVPEDFFYFSAGFLINILTVIYLFILAIYVVKEIYRYQQTRFLNIPKQGLVLGTILSWYFGIVYFKGDLTFTLLNVVSHGIPYMALIWAHGRKQYYQQSGAVVENSFLKLVFSNKGLFIFLGLIALFGFMEEGLWDRLIWQDHTHFFRLFKVLPELNDNWVMLLVIPLLTVPQITHYVLDGFIWRIKKDKYNWKNQTIG